MSKLFTLGLITGIVLFIGGGMVKAKRSAQADSQGRKNSAAEAEFREEVVDATPAEIGVLSDRQRLHSRIAENVRPTGRQEIAEAIASYKGKKIVYGFSIHLNIAMPAGDPEPPANYFGRLAQISDAVIRGKVVHKVSNITEDGA